MKGGNRYASIAGGLEVGLTAYGDITKYIGPHYAVFLPSFLFLHFRPNYSSCNPLSKKKINQNGVQDFFKVQCFFRRPIATHCGTVGYSHMCGAHFDCFMNNILTAYCLYMTKNSF